MKRLGLIIGVITLGLFISEYLMIIENSPIWFRILIIIVTFLITVIMMKVSMPIKINKRYIYLPYIYREKKDEKKIQLSEIRWIKQFKKYSEDRGLRFRTAREEYFIPSFFGQSDEVKDALEEAMGSRFYEVYHGEER